MKTVKEKNPATHMCEQNSICCRLWCEHNVTLMIMDDSRTAGRGSRMIIYPFGMPRLMVGSVYVAVIYPFFFSFCVHPDWLAFIASLTLPPFLHHLWVFAAISSSLPIHHCFLRQFLLPQSPISLTISTICHAKHVPTIFFHIPISP